MMKRYTIIRNAYSCKEESLPLLPMDEWRRWIIDSCKQHEARIVSIFGVKNGDGVKLYGVLGADAKGELRLAATNVEGNSYPALTPECPQAHLFEREIFEGLGVTPAGHPWLKPLRRHKGYEFYSVAGDSIHEVAVGPVHAGVIEPGHFRFQCFGEKVFNLEIQLGYQHRGVEELMLAAGNSKRMVLAESIAGDTTIGHALAYCHVIEALANREVTQRARIIRALALELERIANHVGDLGAIAGDVGFLPAASYFGAIRADFLNMLMALSGNRFGRALLKPGGTAFDITQVMVEDFRTRFIKDTESINDTAELMFTNPAVTTRLERTGIVSLENAKELGLVGVAARACGLQRDVRSDYPAGMYRFKNVLPAKANTGDVFARARVRHIEIKRSLVFVLELLEKLPIEKVYFGVDKLNDSSITVSLIEGWRGEIAHIARTNEKGEVVQYKVIDPSFHNWAGLEIALRSAQISDFPLCNKSFNLSYAGFDL